MYGKNVSPIINRALKEHAQKRTSFKLSDYADYEGGQGLLLSYIANIIYAHMAQIKPFVLNMTYSIGARGEKKVYNQNTTIREHVANINSMLTESEGGDRSKKLFVPDPYYLDKKVKLVELFSYHKLGLTNKYTHLFGDS